VKVLLLFFLATFMIAIHSANRGKPSRAWLLGVVSFGVAVLFLSPRAL
jgi:hypothetical protein